MAEKKWSDYWKKYKSSPDYGKKIPKTPTVKPVKVEKPKTTSYKAPSYKTPAPKPARKGRPKITISPKIPRISKPKVGTGLNKMGILMIILALAVIGLGSWQFESAKTIEVLTGEKTDLECQIGNCTQDLQTTNTKLIACNSNLDICNSDLNGKIIDLNDCNNEKGDINQDYTDCKDDLLQYRRDYQSLEDDYDDCIENLQNKDGDLGECSDDYDDLKGNYLSLCNSHCSQTCTFDSDSQEYTCSVTTTTTTTTTV